MYLPNKKTRFFMDVSHCAKTTFPLREVKYPTTETRFGWKFPLREDNFPFARTLVSNKTHTFVMNCPLREGTYLTERHDCYGLPPWREGNPTEGLDLYGCSPLREGNYLTSMHGLVLWFPLREGNGSTERQSSFMSSLEQKKSSFLQDNEN